MQQVFPAPTPSVFDPDFLPIFLSVHDRRMAKGTIGQYVIQCYCREVGGGGGSWETRVCGMKHCCFKAHSRTSASNKTTKLLGKKMHSSLRATHTCMQISRRGWELTGTQRVLTSGKRGRKAQNPGWSPAIFILSLVFESFMRMSWVIKN